MKAPQAIDMVKLSRQGSFVAGFLAAVVMAIGMILLRLTTGVPTLPELISELVIFIMPISVFSFLLDLLGGSAKPLLLLSLLAGQLLGGGLLGIAYDRFWENLLLEEGEEELAPWRMGWLGVAAYSTALWAITMGGFVLLASAGFSDLTLREPLVVLPLTLAIYLSYGLSLRIWRTLFILTKRPFLAVAPVDEPVLAPPSLARRELLAKMGVGFLTLTAGGVLVGLLAHLGRVGTITRAVRRRRTELPPEVTPNNDFYTVSKNILDPIVSEKEWHLEIGGLVERPFTLAYEELKALPAVSEYVTLVCISNPVGGDLIGNALWRGVPLRRLLEQAGIKPGVVDVVLRAWDGYTDSIPLEKALDPATLVAYEMNGDPLNDDHGYPARVIVPGIYGMKNVKWLTKIELVDYDYKGFWESLGWSDTSIIKTMSRIDVPYDGDKLPMETTYIGGIAFAGDRGISKVEVSIDGGQTWNQADFRKELSPYTWVLWTNPWEPQEAKDYLIKVRATDKTGAVQTAEFAAPEPDGATGYHPIRIWVIPK